MPKAAAHTTEASTHGMQLVEVHSHLIPDVDDGSRSVEESIAMARALVARGYSHLVCTPHIWPDLPHNEPVTIAQRVSELQGDLDRAGVPLRLHTGGEINLDPRLLQIVPDALPSYDGRGQYLLTDVWLWKWESWLTPVVRHLQQGGRTVILAHPERLGMLQDNPKLVQKWQDLGVLLQGNLYCFADEPSSPTRVLADQFLDDNRYFMLGGDLHREDTLASRFAGLERVVGRVGLEAVATLLKTNPRRVLGL